MIILLSVAAVRAPYRYILSHSKVEKKVACRNVQRHRRKSSHLGRAHIAGTVVAAAQRTVTLGKQPIWTLSRVFLPVSFDSHATDLLVVLKWLPIKRTSCQLPSIFLPNLDLRVEFSSPYLSSNRGVLQILDSPW